MYMDLSGFLASVKGQTAAFLGIGVSHTEAIRLFAQNGIKVLACDRRTREQLGVLADELEELGVELVLGEAYLDGLARCDFALRTPGMRFDMPELVHFRARGGVLTSEMELFFRVCPCPIIAVTGSDGKTTSTTLIAKILEHAGRRVHLGGNIGRALLPIAAEISPEDIAVVELSSFQLISMRQSPERALITNITPNHMDMHRDMAQYIDAKKNLFLHQDAFAISTFFADNEITAAFEAEARGKALLFSLTKPVANGAFLRADGMLCYAEDGSATPIVHKDEIALPGIHNVANYLGAACVVRGLAAVGDIRAVASTFAGVEHRIEFVRERQGVRWYNDSIATTPSRAIAGLRSFDRRIVVIAGGSDKQIPFDDFATEVLAHVKLLILCGHTAGKIRAAVEQHPDYAASPLEIIDTDDLTQAVAIAAEKTAAGDVVTLSPACASFDKYRNFEERGRHFKALVNAIND